MVLGTYKEAVSARSTDKKVQKVAQDGGIAPALLIHALEEGMIEGAIVTKKVDDWKVEPFIAMTADEILEAAGTKYIMSPQVFGLKEAVRQYGLEKVGTVVIPCHVWN